MKHKESDFLNNRYSLSIFDPLRFTLSMHQSDYTKEDQEYMKERSIRKRAEAKRLAQQKTATHLRKSKRAKK